MKKKLSIGLGMLVIFALISLNLNFGKFNEDKNISLKELLSLAEADAEDPYTPFCITWCSYSPYNTCSIHVGFNDGSTGWIECGNMVWR